MNISEILQLLAPLKSAIIFLVGQWLLYPISLFVLPRLKSRQSSAIFHIFYGLSFSFILFGWDTLILIGSILIGYVVIDINPIVGSAVGFAMSSFSHILYALRCKGWDLDISGNLMCLFQRLMSLSFNIGDGKALKEGKELKRDHWKKLSLDGRPPFLFYFAYTITPYGSFGNPFIEYKVFEYLLNCGNNPPPDESDRKEALWRYARSYFFAIINIFLMSYVSYDTYKSEFYLQFPPPIRCVFMTLFTLAQLTRYFPGWYSIEAAFIAAGLNKNGIVKPDEITNNSFTYVIQSPTSQEWMRRWNHTTHLFWKEYLFTRMLNAKFNFQITDMTVFTVSALWHGFRPMYYWMLPETLIMMHADKLMSKRWPINENASKVRKILGNLYTLMIMTDSSCTFWYSSTKSFFYVRNSIWWIPLVISLVFLVGLLLIKPKRSSKDSTKKNEVKAETKEGESETNKEKKD